MRLLAILFLAPLLMTPAPTAPGALAQPRHEPGGGGRGGGDDRGPPQRQQHGQGQDQQRGRGQDQQRGRGQDQQQGRGQDQQRGRGQDQQQGRGQPNRIADGDRSLIQSYFGQQFAQGNCPPGLAKKGNGCQPPGQARQWAQGRRLPDGLGYPLPPELLLRLAPPAGHTYMRVGTDILLIALGSRMVVSGMADLLR